MDAQKIDTRSERLGNVLAYELAPQEGYCRKTVTVTVADGMDLGAVLQNNGSGTYVWVANADVATLNSDVVVLIDHFADVPSLAAGDYELAVLDKGPATVKRQGLKYADAVTGPNKAIVEAALEAKDIEMRDRV